MTLFKETFGEEKMKKKKILIYKATVHVFGVAFCCLFYGWFKVATSATDEI